jgi:hypothetical protein
MISSGSLVMLSTATIVLAIIVLMYLLPLIRQSHRTPQYHCAPVTPKNNQLNSSRFSNAVVHISIHLPRRT